MHLHRVPFFYEKKSGKQQKSPVTVQIRSSRGAQPQQSLQLLITSLIYILLSCSLSLGFAVTPISSSNTIHTKSSTLLASSASASSESATTIMTSSNKPVGVLPPPIVYTIAGSDSGGGAGIQADLHAIHSMNCHGCSAITCLTAQNSMGVTGVHSPPVEFLKLQLDTLWNDLKPRAIKIGMLGTKELAKEVGDFLALTCKNRNDDEEEKVYVVLDPVMISTSGHKLIQNEAKEAMIEHIFPYADIVTPNKFEAEELLGRTLNTPQDVEQGAREILDMGCKSVLIKGGHSLIETKGNLSSQQSNNDDVNATIGYAQDYFLSSNPPLTPGEERICDGCRGVWLRSNRYDCDHTHGTGCTLSSAIASALALGHQQRTTVVDNAVGTGATRAIREIDACCLAKAYVTAGIGKGVQLGKGPGPVAQTTFVKSHKHFPSVAVNPISAQTPFIPMRTALSASSSEDTNDDIVTLGKILPIVNNVEWVERLCQSDDITDIQLRIKGETNPDKILDIVTKSQEICQKSGVRLWINDFWKAAVQAGCFGVHVGQEDLARCVDEGGLEKMRECNMALGISTHSYAELAAAVGIKPSYISLGPVFGTLSKDVAFDPQGLVTVEKWRELIDTDVPLVAIGGINDTETALRVKNAGADCVAVISAVTKANDVDQAIKELTSAMT